MSTAPSRRATAVGASVLALTGCSAMMAGDGFLEQSPRSMAKDAFADMQKVTSMRILGRTDADTGPIRVDMRVDGTSCAGNLDTDDGRIQIVKNDDGAWFKAEPRFWRTQASSRQAGEAAAKAYADSWVVLEPTKGKKGKGALLEMCDLDALLAEFELDADDTKRSIEAGEVVQVDDQAAVPLTGHDGTERITVWVAVAPPHRVLKLAPEKDKGMPDALIFDDVGDDVVADTPPAKDIVTIPGS